MRIKDNAREGDPAPSSAERDVADELFTSAIHAVNPSAKPIVNVDKPKNDVLVFIGRLVRVTPNSNDHASNLLRLLWSLYSRFLRWMGLI
jgi:hypothetical protein